MDKEEEKDDPTKIDGNQIKEINNNTILSFKNINDEQGETDDKQESSDTNKEESDVTINKETTSERKENLKQDNSVAPDTQSVSVKSSGATLDSDDDSDDSETTKTTKETDSKEVSKSKVVDETADVNKVISNNNETSQIPSISDSGANVNVNTTVSLNNKDSSNESKKENNDSPDLAKDIEPTENSNNEQKKSKPDESVDENTSTNANQNVIEFSTVNQGSNLAIGAEITISESPSENKTLPPTEVNIPDDTEIKQNINANTSTKNDSAGHITEITAITTNQTLVVENNNLTIQPKEPLTGIQNENDLPVSTNIVPTTPVENDKSSHESTQEATGSTLKINSIPEIPNMLSIEDLDEIIPLAENMEGKEIKTPESVNNEPLKEPSRDENGIDSSNKQNEPIDAKIIQEEVQHNEDANVAMNRTSEQVVTNATDLDTKMMQSGEEIENAAPKIDEHRIDQNQAEPPNEAMSAHNLDTGNNSFQIDQNINNPSEMPKVETETAQESAVKRDGRKEIADIISDDQCETTTKNAALEEIERRRRVEERNRLFKERVAQKNSIINEPLYRPDITISNKREDVANKPTVTPAEPEPVRFMDEIEDDWDEEKMNFIDDVTADEINKNSDSDENRASPKGAPINLSMYTTPTGKYVLCPHCDNFLELKFIREHIAEFHIDQQQPDGFWENIPAVGLENGTFMNPKPPKRKKTEEGGDEKKVSYKDTFSDRIDPDLPVPVGATYATATHAMCSFCDSFIDRKHFEQHLQTFHDDEEWEKAGEREDVQVEGGKGGRKDIKAILDDDKLTDETKKAAIEEIERRKRIQEKTRLFEEKMALRKPATSKPSATKGEKFDENDLPREGAMVELPLDFEDVTMEACVEVNPYLVKHFKPHQGRGIKFLWDAVFESKDELMKNKIPGGAILAHCMGLGKTLQTIGLIHTVATTFPAIIRCILVICPVVTIKNWVDEFAKWLDGPLLNDLKVFDMCKLDNWGRQQRLESWRDQGGVMVIGYDMFRNLSNENSKKFTQKQFDTFKKCLVDPGPDMVVCDEGHILKNTKSALNHAMTKITTRRRIILTGTPLQNNLSEYFAMVDFVKPNLLGTYKEFQNRFVNPIQNGQHSDSTPRDVRIMKKRSFILNDLLKGAMQRLNYNVLVPYLKPKHEYVLFISLSPYQKKLYRYYLKNFARAGQIGSEGKLEGGKKGGLFYDVRNLSHVWNHPFILVMAKQRSGHGLMFEDEDEINERCEREQENIREMMLNGEVSKREGDMMIEESESKRRQEIRDRKGRSKGGETKGWWDPFIDRKLGDERTQLNKLELGSKMVLLMDILKEAEQIGDKVLVFSQSILSLNLIEEFLQQQHAINQKNNYASSIPHGGLKNYLGSWQAGRDYFRMDGSTNMDQRKQWCDYFNMDSNPRSRLFLISTRAGGLGINLVAANRVIIFDASWNPAHDVQSIFRVYRFGQIKPVFIYRFLALGTMEEKIYDRQVTKQSLSARVVDEHQIGRHFSLNELAELYEFNDEDLEERPRLVIPKDQVLKKLLMRHNIIWKYHNHDSLLENQIDENLTTEEQNEALQEFEDEKNGNVNLENFRRDNRLMLSSFNANENSRYSGNQYINNTDRGTGLSSGGGYSVFDGKTRSYITGKEAYNLANNIHSSGGSLLRKPLLDNALKSHIPPDPAKIRADRERELLKKWQESWKNNNPTTSTSSNQQSSSQSNTSSFSHTPKPTPRTYLKPSTVSQPANSSSSLSTKGYLDSKYASQPLPKSTFLIPGETVAPTTIPKASSYYSTPSGSSSSYPYSTPNINKPYPPSNLQVNKPYVNSTLPLVNRSSTTSLPPVGRNYTPSGPSVGRSNVSSDLVGGRGYSNSTQIGNPLSYYTSNITNRSLGSSISQPSYQTTSNTAYTPSSSISTRYPTNNINNPMTRPGSYSGTSSSAIERQRVNMGISYDNRSAQQPMQSVPLNLSQKQPTYTYNNNVSNNINSRGFNQNMYGSSYGSNYGSNYGNNYGSTYGSSYGRSY